MTQNEPQNAKTVRLHPTTREKLSLAEAARPADSIMGLLDRAVDLLLADMGIAASSIQQNGDPSPQSAPISE